MYLSTIRPHTQINKIFVAQATIAKGLKDKFKELPDIL